MMKAKAGEHVRWYVMAMGTEVDLHTPHWHGTTVTSMASVDLLPAGMRTADMVADNSGIWLFHATSTTTSRPAWRPATSDPVGQGGHRGRARP
jgi:hypothetical protein